MAFSKMRYDAFFNNIPSVPLAEICRHLSPVDKLTYSLDSEHWKDAAKACKPREEVTIDVRIDNHSDSLNIHFESGNTPDFYIIYRMFWHFKNDVHLARDSWNQMETLNFHNRRLFEDDNAFEVLRCVGQLFTVKYRRIVVSLRHRPPDFSLRLLSSLPPGKADLLLVEECEHSFQFEHLEKLMRNVKFTKEIRICPRLTGVFASDEIRLDVEFSLELENALFLTRKHMETAMFKTGTFGENSLTSEDFNVFFRRWKDGLTRRDMSEVRFRISKDQKISVEEVVKGLDAKPWDAEVRDRIWCDPNDNVFNMGDGLDMENIHGMLGTLHLKDNTLMFVTWTDRFVAVQSKNRLEDRAADYRRELAICENHLNGCVEDLCRESDDHRYGLHLYHAGLKAHLERIEQKLEVFRI